MDNVLFAVLDVYHVIMLKIVWHALLVIMGIMVDVHYVMEIQVVIFYVWIVIQDNHILVISVNPIILV